MKNFLLKYKRNYSIILTNKKGVFYNYYCS